MKTILFTTICFCWLILLAEPRPPRLNKNKNSSNEWVENKTIYGKWEWFKTECCGSKKGTINTESFGDQIYLDLNADNTFTETSKKYRVPRTGEIFLTKETQENESFDVIRFNDERPARYSLSGSGDTLILAWDYLELQTEYFQRKK
jgi:hypothetical protein